MASYASFLRILFSARQRAYWDYSVPVEYWVYARSLQDLTGISLGVSSHYVLKYVARIMQGSERIICFIYVRYLWSGIRFAIPPEVLQTPTTPT